MRPLSTLLDIPLTNLETVGASYQLACYYTHQELDKNPKEKPTQLYIVVREMFR